MRGIPGTPFCSMGQEFWAGARKALAKGLLPLLALLLGTYPASAQSAEDASPPATASPPEASAPDVLPTPAPRGPQTSPEPLLPAVRTAPAKHSSQVPLPAALVPAIEARVGFSTLSRVSGPNNRVLFQGICGSVTKQSSERLGGTLEVSYLRASNVFNTGRSNSLFTYLIGPVLYPYRRAGFITSLHALGGGARVSGVVVLLPNSAGFLKGTTDDRAWALGGGLEKWFFGNSMALRVDIDALHTTFYNNVAKVHGEYDLRATWGIIYYFGGRRRGGEFRNVAGRQIE